MAQPPQTPRSIRKISPSSIGLSTAVLDDRVSLQGLGQLTTTQLLEIVDFLKRENRQLKTIIRAQKEFVIHQHNTKASHQNELASFRKVAAEEQKLAAMGFPLPFHSEEFLALYDHPNADEQMGDLYTPAESQNASGSESRQSKITGPSVSDPRPEQNSTQAFKMKFNKHAMHAKGAFDSSNETGERTETIGIKNPSPFRTSDMSYSWPPQNLLHPAGFPAHLTHKDSDQSMLKPPGLNVGGPEQLANPQAPSKTLTASTLESPPPLKPDSSSQEKVPGLPKLDTKVEGAGHATSTREKQGDFILMDGSASNGDDFSTPKTEASRFPLEPFPPLYPNEPIRQPSKIQDSYSGSVDAPAEVMIENPPPMPPLEQSPDHDVAPLEGPLGLTNSPEAEHNKEFLGELNKKLSQADLTKIAGNAESPSVSPPIGDPSKPTPDTARPELKNVDGSPCEVLEPEPPLRLKQSSNFGSAFGKAKEVDYGKGFAKRDP